MNRSGTRSIIVVFAILLYRITPIYAGELPGFHFASSYTNMAGLIEVYDDFSKTLTIDDISQLPPSQWSLNSEAVIYRGIIDAHVWMHFRIDASKQTETETPRGWKFVINQSLLKSVSLYVLQNDGTLNRHTSTTNLAHIIELPIKAGQTNEYFVRINPESPLVLPIGLYSPEAFSNWHQTKLIAISMYYGAMIIMSVLFLILAMMMSSPVYLAFFGMMFFLTLYNMSLDGFLQSYLLQDKYISTNSTIRLAILYSLSSLFFFASFLQIRHRSPFFFKLFVGVFIASLLHTAATFTVKASTLVTLHIFYCLLFFSVVFTASLKIYFSGFKEARFMYWAQWISIISALPVIATYNGIIPATPVFPYYFHIGSFCTIILAALALVDQYRQYRNDLLDLERSAKVKLETINKELVRSNQAKDLFLSTISHELRTPMSGITGSLNLLATAISPQQQADLLFSATQSASDMTRMVDDLVCLSEVRGQQLPSKKRAITFAELKSDLPECLQRKANERNIRLTLILKGNPLHRFESDPTKLNCIFFHLISNAIKFTNEGKVEATWSYDVSSPKGAFIDFWVWDTGIGISNEHLNSLFDAFNQVDGSFSRQFGGLGIGLTLSKSLIDSLSGTLRITSNPGKGTLVSVSIPVLHLGTQNEQTTAPEQIPHINNGRCLHALVVEDNPVNQKVLTTILQKMNVRTSTANNGMEGYQMCRSNRFDIILMDCQMPGMDGFESTKKIRQLEGYLTIPIIAVTANVSAQDIASCFGAGMDDYLKKPINAQDIKAILEKYIYQQNSMALGFLNTDY